MDSVNIETGIKNVGNDIRSYLLCIMAYKRASYIKNLFDQVSLRFTLSNNSNFQIFRSCLRICVPQ